MTETLTLTDFLLARIAEDEVLVRSALVLYGSGTTHPLGSPLDPARVLAECAAKRQIVEDFETLHRDYAVTHDPSTEARRFQARVAMAYLATVYADHADYSDDWRP